MTRKNLLRLLVMMAVFILISGLVILIRSPAVEADLTVGPVQERVSSQVTNVATAAKCMECHHSEQLSRVERLTTDPKPDLRPAWSPDSIWLAFYSSRSGNDDIWAVRVDGGDETQLTEDPASDRRPSWSPDGTRIVFDSDRSGSHDIWVMNADGSDQRQLTTSPSEEMFASFSPDGSQVLFYSYEAGRNDIWAIDADGGNLKSLTSGLADEKQNQCTFACHTPAFSPDGNTIAFHADNDGTRNIWLMDADGANLRQLTTTSASAATHNYLPSWTPDGRIIFQAERPIAQTIRTDIRVIDPDGSNEITLFAEVAHGGPFAWSPDGTRVALHSQRGGAGNFDIFVATFGEAAEEEALEEEEVPAEVEATTPEEVRPPSEEATSSSEEGTSPATVTFSLGGAGTIAAVGVSFLLVLAAVVYGLRRFRRD
jgi:TolB protein